MFSLTETQKRVAVAVGVVVCLGGAFYAGRKSVPRTIQTTTETAKVETSAKLEEIKERIVYVKAKDVAKRYRKKVTELAGGSRITEISLDTKVDEDVGQVKVSQSTGLEIAAKAEDAKTETTVTASNRDFLHFSVDASLPVGAIDFYSIPPKPKLTLGAEVRVVGPLWLGASVSTWKEVGLRVGLSF